MEVSMKSAVCLLAMAFLATSGPAVQAGDNAPSMTNREAERDSMSEQQTMIALFDRWERVWHDGQLDLVPSCVGDHYIRHDEGGDRTVSRDVYAAEIVKVQRERPGIRVVVYDHTFQGNRAWFRFAVKWNDPKTGEAHSRAGMQSYRTEDGKLVETWLSMQPLGSAWPDMSQEHWTSPPAIK
jgi:predicted SnoaL-like aldol condensation-catalyzing enzyme